MAYFYYEPHTEYRATCDSCRGGHHAVRDIVEEDKK